MPVDELTPATRPTQLPSLTSLRWVAATVVFLRHAQVGAHLGAQGATGVSFFFILSGFVLSWSHRENQGSRSFMTRRFARVYPAYLTVTLLVIPLYFLVGRFNSVGEAFRGLFTLTLLQSWIPDPRWFFAGNGVSWSLADEAFFYVVFPLAILGLAGLTRGFDRRRALSLVAVLVTIGIAVPCILRPSGETGWEFWFIYINPAFRIVEFLIGMCLARLVASGELPRIRLAWAAGLAAVAYVVAGWVPMWAMWSAVTLVPYTLLIVAAAQSDISGATNRILGSHPMLRLGVWSYAFYLVHEAVLTVLRAVNQRAGIGLPVVALAPVGYVAAIAAAAIVFRFVERPAQRLLIDRLDGRVMA